MINPSSNLVSAKLFRCLLTGYVGRLVVPCVHRHMKDVRKLRQLFLIRVSYPVARLQKSLKAWFTARSSFLSDCNACAVQRQCLFLTHSNGLSSDSLLLSREFASRCSEKPCFSACRFFGGPASTFWLTIHDSISVVKAIFALTDHFFFWLQRSFSDDCRQGGLALFQQTH